MAQPTRKVEFIAGRIVETASGSPAVTVIDAITDSLLNAAEASGPMKFNLAASAVDTPLSMGNVATAKFLFIQTDGAVSIKLNGSITSLPLNKTMLFVGTISGILASNPSASEVRAVTLYAATDTD